MVKQNQGFRRDLNLIENTNDTQALSNLAGAGIANDLRILQNNLRNIGTFPFESLSNGFFFFGDDNEFIFTNDDIISVSANTDLGGGVSLIAGTDYYVCNSDGRTKFKLSYTPSTIGVTTIPVVSVANTNFIFIRKDYVTQENILNFIKPEIQDDQWFSFMGGEALNDAIDITNANNDFAEYLITQKFKGNSDTTSSKTISIEGVVTTQDPTLLNATDAGLAAAKSPGIYIQDTRAFSVDNNPWNKVGTALSTGSSLVTVGELFFADGITITGISTEAATEVSVTSFTHKLPIKINNEVYYLLLRST